MYSLHTHDFDDSPMCHIFTADEVNIMPGSHRVTFLTICVQQETWSSNFQLDQHPSPLMVANPVFPLLTIT